jgi:predicted deacylase
MCASRRPRAARLARSGPGPFRSPGDNLSAGETIGLVRARDGAVRQTIRAARDGLLLALQPISAVHVGSWLATIASHPPEEDP